MTVMTMAQRYYFIEQLILAGILLGIFNIIWHIILTELLTCPFTGKKLEDERD